MLSFKHAPRALKTAAIATLGSGTALAANNPSGNNTPMSTNCSSSSALVESLNSHLQGVPPLVVTLILLFISFIIAVLLR
ncbi:MAG: hypothetical protein LBS59_08240 [Puniceicoccales bacterium]|nr:hypothetical protein [Puniceicoccales bacterium]